VGYRLLCAADWAALVVICENLLMQPEKVAELPGVKEDRKLPRVLTLEEQIKKLRETGLTVLLAEQNVRSALRLGDRGYIIDNGQIRYQGSIEEL